MTYSVNKKDIQSIAEELGMKVQFNSPTPGVLNVQTGERNSLISYFEEFLSEEAIYEEDLEFEVDNIKAIKVKPKRVDTVSYGINFVINGKNIA